MRRSFSRRAQPRRWALAAARCTARLAWCACALRGGQGAWRAARGASSGLGPPFEGSLARWGVVARWGCSSRACRSLVLDLACWCLQNSDPELSAIYCGSWQFGRVSQSFLGFRRLQFLRLQLQVLRLRLRLQVSRLRLRVWRRDVPPGSCCASVAQGPDGGQSTARSGSSTAAPASAATVCCGAGERRDSVLLLRLVALATPHSLCSSPRRARPRGPSGRLPAVARV